MSEQYIRSINMKIRRESQLINEFESLIGHKVQIDDDFRESLQPYLEHIGKKSVRSLVERKKYFIAYVNKKFNLNANGINQLFTKIAMHGKTFNFHQKTQIQRAFDLNDIELFNQTLLGAGLESSQIDELKVLFNPLNMDSTLEYINSECINPSKLRISKGNRNIENEILKALLSSFLWVTLPTKEMHEYFDPTFSESAYKKSFWEQLQINNPNLFNRENALHIWHINQDIVNKFPTKDAFVNFLMQKIPDEYATINNHGFLAIIVDNVISNSLNIDWEVVSSIILYADKFREIKLNKSYFRWSDIQNATAKYIKEIDIPKAQFDLANEGFTYRDTFVVADDTQQVNRRVIVFQKNERDEHIIPCPICRTHNVQGNSYPVLGVRSWECKNPLCPERSKYNRGRRYSFRELLMQQAIEDDKNIISQELIKHWKRDVVMNDSLKEILEALIKSYSLVDDKIDLYNCTIKTNAYLGRNIHTKNISIENVTYDISPLDSLRFFNRYLYIRENYEQKLKNLGDQDFQVYSGNSENVLGGFNDNYFDGAVTSPPYYNAREYSQWPNLYCYLYDMYNINRQVYRTLKPGAVYLYNIFDYFDNENTVALSAMGKRRMILSAYTVDLFKKIGFQLLNNIVWDKGEIEGKRGFNHGNFSPFYQAPFNCWEHILVFVKPPVEKHLSDNIIQQKLTSKTIFRCKPVMKMLNGKNTHGHTAPFPDELPGLLINEMTEGQTVLDPFAGSLTTGRVAEQKGVRSVNIEMLTEYCMLGLSKRKLRG